MKMDIEKKRKKEQRVVEEMIRLYCRKNHAEYDRRTGRMCPACRELSGYALLSAYNAGADPAGHAIFRAENAVVSSRSCHLACGLQHKGKARQCVISRKRTGLRFFLNDRNIR